MARIRLAMGWGAIIAAIVLLSPAAQFSPAALAADSVTDAPAGADAALISAWPQLVSDIPSDDAVLFGVLANGMRYAIRHNETPPGQVAIRLRIGAGSIHERDDQRGLAHFLEHLAFRGSTQVPDGEVQRILERLGLRMGGDTNASTSLSQTVYRFDLPSNDETTVATGLMLMREIASELTLDPEAMEKERGVILSEERVTDTSGMRVRRSQSEFLMRGQLAPLRTPIGEVEVIENAPASLVAEFYRAYYRPERATLIVAGDIDPVDMEAKIAARFGDWRGTSEAGPEPDLGMPAERGPEAALYTEEATPPFVTVSWVSPFDDSPPTRARMRRDRVEAIGFMILNERLQRAGSGTDPPFLSAGITRNNVSESAKITTIGATYEGRRWEDAFRTINLFRRQVLEAGVRQDEVDREVGAILARFEARAARGATTTSTTFAGDILNSADDGEVFASAQTEFEIASEDLRGLTAEEVDDAFQGAFDGNGPFVFLSTAVEIEGGGEALAAVYSESEDAPVAAEAEREAAVWPYTAFGTPGTIADQRYVEDLDVTFVRFGNGVNLTVKPTVFRVDQVLVEVRVGGGLLVLPDDMPETVWATLGGGFVTGGLEELDYVDMRRALAAEIYTTRFGTAEDAFVLSGTTRKTDLDTQLQVLAAYVAAPGWRPEAFQRAQNGWATELERGNSSPGAVLGRNLSLLLHSGDTRWSSPASVDDVRRTRIEDLRAVIGAALAGAPIAVTVVGDIGVAGAIEAVAATFGALPPRQDAAFTPPSAGDVRFPAATAEPVVLHHEGRDDQGLAFIAWPVPDFFAGMQEAATLDILSDIVGMRLSEELRAEGGATYAPQSGSRGSLTFPGYGYFYAMAEIPPDRHSYFYDTVVAVIADIGANGPNEDELERVRRPAIDSLERAMQGNRFWLGLRGAYEDERKLAMIRGGTARLEAVSAADVRQAAAKYLIGATEWKLVVVPGS